MKLGKLITWISSTFTPK